MKMREFQGEQDLRHFFTSIGIQPRIAESALSALRTDGSASILSVVLPEHMLKSLGLIDETPLPLFAIRFTVFHEPNGPF
jgi:hypothetical protein